MARMVRRTSPLSTWPRYAHPRPRDLAARDANEVVEAYRYVMQLRHQPAVLALSRPAATDSGSARLRVGRGVARGAYVLADGAGRQIRRRLDRLGQ